MSEKIVETLAKEWRTSGVTEGDVLLVHASLKKLFLKVEKDFGERISPKTIYDSLLRAIGAQGTLILPLFNFDFPKKKFFDIRNTPSQMGALSEIGRNAKNAVRTGHPIYSFSVIGKHAHEFLAIDNKSGYGPDSPFAKIQELNGKIAIIGLTDQFSMTSYHFVEEQNLVDYRYFKDFPGEYIDATGEMSNKIYSLYVRDLEKGVKTDVNRMMEHFWQIGAYQGNRPEEGFGMRIIDFNLLYNETDRIIKNGEAVNYLYSIEK